MGAILRDKSKLNNTPVNGKQAKAALDNGFATSESEFTKAQRDENDNTNTKINTNNYNQNNDTKQQYKLELVWLNIVLFIILHSSLPIGVYLIIRERPWKTILFSLFGIYASALGVTGGCHRLWSHRAYKARWPVELLLMALQTMAGQNSIYTWSRDHRLHHKFSETNADPHNINRGFFFAHMGWLCCRKHPDVKEKGKLIDMSDLKANPIVAFQHRHFWWLSIIFNLLIPIAIPCLLWNEKVFTSFIFSFMIRYLLTLHGTWLVNSAAHTMGSRPYDKRIEARESPYVIFTAIGEGFHNYHHTFPYDYAAGEFGKYLNITTAFIDFCSLFNLTYDLRKVNQSIIDKRRLRTGSIDEINGITHKHESIDESSCCDTSPNKQTNQASNGNGNAKNYHQDDSVHEHPYKSGQLRLEYTM